MNAQARGLAAPERILLATDLGPRSDRALDRAVQLARAWGAQIVAATVVEENASEARAMLLRDPPSWYRGEDPVRQAERRLLDDASAQDVEIVVRVRQGDPADRLLELARAECCGLIVTGVARQEALGRMLLGSTVDRLARRSPVPVLAVRRRVHAAYRRMVVASDWSDSSVHAMRTAMDLFPEAAASVLHGYEVPMAGLLDTARDEAIDQAGERALADGRAFIERGRPPAGADSVGLVVERGDPALLLPLYANQYPVDLAVVASHGRSALFDILLGSVAQRLLEASPVDTLVVRDPRARAG
ncbi:universal stress protein UspA [Pseudoxanthomonas broegbernensis]|uniref:Universal stress protein UspA n=1 Tax=Pseudoxanthomonas broegbernensis TaxID=83619 RepID=A0A7V8K7B0_9GAMM|nr:universal stress protein [Pseudoxanthomonas broegbernensis]KAF1686359.1 universal stress protein UspA [Pseudoxanthomonas broegbernensis]MBB6064053.1 nucleotide-binding universal stress UspA family protein [Pseudoxanthomonas broegbernensis]